jgi:hypothetical protein
MSGGSRGGVQGHGDMLKIEFVALSWPSMFCARHACQNPAIVPDAAQCAAMWCTDVPFRARRFILHSCLHGLVVLDGPEGPPKQQPRRPEADSMTIARGTESCAFRT